MVLLEAVGRAERYPQGKDKKEVWSHLTSMVAVVGMSTTHEACHHCCRSHCLSQTCQSVQAAAAVYTDYLCRTLRMQKKVVRILVAAVVVAVEVVVLLSICRQVAFARGLVLAEVGHTYLEVGLGVWVVDHNRILHLAAQVGV